MAWYRHTHGVSEPQSTALCPPPPFLRFCRTARPLHFLQHFLRFQQTPVHFLRDFAMSLWRASVSTHGAQDRAPRCMCARHTAFALPGPLLPASMALLVRPAHRLFKSPRMRGMAGTRLGIHATFGWKMRSISGVHSAFSACGRLRTLRTRGGCAHAKIGDLAPCAWVGPHHAAPVACLWVGGGPSSS